MWTSQRPGRSCGGRQPDHHAGLLGVGEHGRARDEPPDVTARHRVGDDADRDVGHQPDGGSPADRWRGAYPSRPWVSTDPVAGRQRTPTSYGVSFGELVPLPRTYGATFDALGAGQVEAELVQELTAGSPRAGRARPASRRPAS